MRLNGNSRAIIIGAALARFDTKLTALQKEEDVLCRKLHKLLVPAAERKAAEALNNIKAGWVKTYFQFNFNIAGQGHVLRCLGEPLIGPATFSSQCQISKALTYDMDRPLVDRVRKMANDVETTKEERKRAQKQLQLLLRSVGSTDSLLKAWPEGKKFYASPPLTSTAAASSLPAPQIEALNKMLGLVD